MLPRGEQRRGFVENGVKSRDSRRREEEEEEKWGENNPLISLSLPGKLGIKETPVV